MNNNSRQQASLFINGERHLVGGAHAFMMLADYLRYERELCGTKIVCAEGDCGACTVLCTRDHERFYPINACIALVATLDGCHLITVEALAKNGKLSTVQAAIVEHHGSQCGFCTPGFVMAMSGMFEKPCNELTPQRVKNCLTGNLCRCTGYQPLINAALSLDTARIEPLAKRFTTTSSTQELRNARQKPMHVIDKEREFFAPLTIADAVRFRQTFPDARVVSGATDIGVLVNKGRSAPKRYLSLHLIDAHNAITEVGDRIVVGACARLSDVRHFVKDRVPEFANFLNLFASPQIKNMATLVGNVANGSPIADTIPFLMVTDGHVHVTGNNETRTIAMCDLSIGYKMLALKPAEIITHISFTKPTPRHLLRLEKVSQRKDLDISTVNMACSFDVLKTGVVNEARIAVGGVSWCVVRLAKTEALLTGQQLDGALIDRAAKQIAHEITPLDDIRGSAEYRRALVDGLFRRYCHGVMTHE